VLEMSDDLLDVVSEQQGLAPLDPRAEEGRVFAIKDFSGFPRIGFRMTEVENLGGMRDEVVHEVPNPARPVGEHDDLGSSLAMRLLMDLGKKPPKLLTVGHLSSEHFGQ
jgi:hypothetical protein